jgi:geranylgeranyl diphosphate synthase type 3
MYVYTINTAFFLYRTDDIQDNSILRRGIPVAHSVYGIASALSAANYVLFIALERVVNLQRPAVNRKYYVFIHTIRLIIIKST